MPRRDLNTFQRTRLAVAVAAISVSLGACSSMPRDESLGGQVADVGRTTAEVGSRLWDRTVYLLGFGEASEYENYNDRRADPRLRAGRTDSDLLDEVDLALLQEDAVMPGDNAPGGNELSDQSLALAGDEERVDDLFDGERVLVEDAVDGELTPVSTSDLTHEVGQDETLWDIAKMATGDATNWHVLADVNDLAPDAAVYPGQTLVVPADLVRPEFAGFTTTAQATAQETPAATGDAAGESGVQVIAQTTAAPIERLAIPGAQGDTTAEPLLADAAEALDAGSATDDLPTGGTELRLGAGETLWDFSKRTTGDATNWRAIAAANGFSDEQATRVYENMRITVPTALLRDDKPIEGVASSATVAAAPAAAEPAVEAVAEKVFEPIADAEISLPVTAAEEVFEPIETASVTGTATDENQPIRIVEAAYRSEADDLAGGAAAATAAAAGAAADAVASNAPREVMVSGTYYPKAVYNDADFSSSLLMRVSPGTTLQVSRAVGSWYEVATDQGTGFVHARDIK